MKTRRVWKIAGINFDHFHMGDLLRFAREHPHAEVVGVSDEQPARMEEAVRKLGLPRDRVFADYRQCLERTKPDVVILCPAAARHGEWVKKVAPYGAHLLVEKPFAASLKEADAMVAAMPRDRTLMINWPLQWVATHQAAYASIGRGEIGEVLNVWHFGGNRGPLFHGADKVKKTAAQVAAEKPDSGEIMAVGSGKIGDDGKVRPLDVKKGDKVLFGKYSGQTVKVDGVEYLVMREEDLMGVIEG